MDIKTNKMIKEFTDLVVWQEGHRLAILIYTVTKSFPREEVYSLIDQTRRAASSVTANIAEGFGRNTMKDKMQFFYIARGSLTELKNHILLARDINYLSGVKSKEILDQIMQVERLLHGLIRKSRTFLPRVPISALLILITTIGYLLSTSAAYASALAKPANNLGLVGYWSFNDATGTKATDSSGRGNTGTTQNIAAPPTATSDWGAGKFGAGMMLDGSNDYVEVPSSASLQMSSAVTVSAWVKMRSLSSSADQDIVIRGNDTVSNYYIWFNFKTTIPACGPGHLVVGFYGGGNFRDLCSVKTNWATDTWYHVSFSYDQQNILLYVNGAQDNSLPNTNAMDTTASVLRIGSKRGVTPDEFFNGTLDEVRIYNRALGATEVAALYNSGAAKTKIANNLGLVGYWSMDDATGTIATDSSILRNSATWSGSGGANTTPSWAKGQRGYALNFDGTDDNLSLATESNFDFERTQAFSVVSWVKPNVTRSGVEAGYNIFSKLDHLTPFRGFEFGIDWNQEAKLNKSTLKFFLINTFMTNFIDVNGNTDLQNGIWYHLAVTYDGSSTASGTKMYIDGASEAVTANYNNLNATTLNNITPRIGSRNAAGVYMKGSIDDVRVYNRELSATEIANLYASGETKINSSTNTQLTNTQLTNGLVGLWSFNGHDIRGTTAYDRSGQGNNGTLTNGPAPISGKMGQALRFDGVDDYVGVSSAHVIKTISLWVNPKSSGGALYTSGGYNFVSITGSNELYIQCNGCAGPPNTYNFGQVITLNEWQHIGLSFTLGGGNAIVKAYRNGVSIGSTTLLDGYSAESGLGEIGGYNGASNIIDGSIDEVRVYNRVLTDSEIQQLYSLGK